MAGESPSLRDALSAAWDAQGAGSSSSSDATPAAVDSGASSAAGVESTSAPAASSSAARDAAGRFASSSADATGGTTAPGGEPSAAGASSGAGGGAVTMPDGYDPAVWSSLAPEHQAAVSSWASKAIGERDGKLKGWEPVERVLASRRDALTATYGGVDRGLEQLLAMSDFAGRDPRGFVQWFAQQRGLSLGGAPAAPAQGQRPAAANTDPRQLVSQAVEQALAQREVDTSFREFMADGASEHRNDPTVKRVMAALLQSGTATDYRSAYGMAVQAHPELGPKLRAAEAASAAQAAAAERAKATSAKVQAAASVTGAPGTARPASGGAAPATVRAALQAAWNSNAAGARV